MNCERVRNDLTLLIYGELSFTEEEAAEQHLAGCEDCRLERDRLRAVLAAVEREEAPVGHQLLADNRRQLRLALDVAHARPWWQRLLVPAPAFLKQAFAAVALMGVGFAAGHWYTARAVDTPDPIASRVRYVEPNASGRVRIVVEETSQRTLSGRMDEEPIRRLLLAAARDSSDPGLRVDSVDLLKGSASAEVKRTLLYAVQNDANAGVRLKALQGLSASAATDPETRKALTAVVLNDENPGVRTQAIDLLIQKREASMVGVLQELMAREDNEYVRLRCQRALNDMKASTEIF